jgi:predicted HicB family RNase H-like nuclease
MIGGVNNYTYRAKLVIEANEQGVSLNHWVVQKLAGRDPTPSLHDLF